MFYQKFNNEHIYNIDVAINKEKKRKQLGKLYLLANKNSIYEIYLQSIQLVYPFLIIQQNSIRLLLYYM